MFVAICNVLVLVPVLKVLNTVLNALETPSLLYFRSVLVRTALLKNQTPKHQTQPPLAE